MDWFLVFLGGGAGSLCRYALAVWLPSVDLGQGDFPLATLVANGLACLLLSLGLVLLAREILSKPMSFLLLTGFCGGFSTFSTFSAELFTLYQSGHYGTALAYLGGSLLIGIISVWSGLILLR